MTEQSEDISQALDQLSLRESQALLWEIEASACRKVMRKEYDECVANVDFDKLLQYVRELRPDVKCRLMPAETMGGNNLVRVVQFDDGERWIARIQFVAAGNASRIARRRSDVHTTMLLAEHGLQVPKIYGYDVTDEKIGRSFILMEYLSGFACTDLMNLTEEERAKRFPKMKGITWGQYTDNFLRDLAAFHARMASIRMPEIGALYRNEKGILEVGSCFGSGPHTSATAYLQDWAKRRYFGRSKASVMKSSLQIMSEEEAEARWEEIMNFPNALSAIAQNLKSTPGETFPLVHADLNLNNIIVDEEHNFVGVVDWDKSETVPWEAVELPYFLFYKREGLNTYLWQGKHRASMEKQAANEARYIKFVEEAEKKYGLDDRLSSTLKDKRWQYLSTCLRGYPEGHPFNYEYLQTLFAEEDSSN